jgi:hypothetical protein
LATIHDSLPRQLAGLSLLLTRGIRSKRLLCDPESRLGRYTER